MSKKLELLAPAGNFDALRAAVCGGADAVYLGLDVFNARRGADNFRGAHRDLHIPARYGGIFPEAGHDIRRRPPGRPWKMHDRSNRSAHCRVGGIRGVS